MGGRKLSGEELRVARVVSVNIIHCRLAAGLKQSEVAAILQVEAAEVSHLESGRRLPRLATLLAMAGALGVPLVRLLQDPPDETYVRQKGARRPLLIRKGFHANLPVPGDRRRVGGVG